MQVVVHTDGGSRGNPGKSAIGVVITAEGTSLLAKGLYIGIGTNNRAEYMAVLEALNWLQSHSDNITKANFYLDSLLVMSQITGVYAVKHPDMKELKTKVDVLRRALPFPTEFAYVPRAQNHEADALVNQALDAFTA